MPKNSNPQHPCLPPEKLRWRCDPASIPFETTAEIEPVSGDIGQERALRALRMGVELTAPGYNVFVCGLSGTSRGGMIVRMIEDMHPQTEPAPDRCYVNNFKNADRPRLLTLPRGQANAFKKDMSSRASTSCAGAFRRCSRASRSSGRRAASWSASPSAKKN